MCGMSPRELYLREEHMVADTEGADGTSLARETYIRLKELWTGTPVPRSSRRKSKPRGSSEPFDTGRDPEAVGETLGVVASQLGWEKSLAEGALMVDWPSIVGPETHANTTIESLDDGTLRVRCSSTAWSTQLSLLSSEILSRIVREHPDAGITKIVFIGPNVPSWKRGPKSVPGRGARDTYG